MTSQAVSAPTWNDAQCRFRMNQRTCHLVDGPITSHGHYHIDSLLDSPSSIFSSMSFPLSILDGIIKAFRIHVIRYQLNNMFLASRTRNGIDDEPDFFLFCHFVLQMYCFFIKNALLDFQRSQKLKFFSSLHIIFTKNDYLCQNLVRNPNIGQLKNRDGITTREMC